MSEPVSKQTNHESSRPAYGEVSSQSLTDPTDRTRESMLWFIILYSLLVGIFRKWLPWLPWYQAVGIGCFIVGLVTFRFRGPRLRHYGFGKYLIYYLLVSAGFSIAAFAMEALVSVFSR